MTNSRIRKPLQFDDWTALASLGMSVMFVGLLISFYSFLIGPDGQGPQRQVLVFPVQMQIMSISGIPAIIMAGIDYVLARNAGAKRAGFILIGAGVIMAIGMVAAAPMISKIKEEFLAEVIDVVPHVFAIGGAAIAAIGALLVMKTKGASDQISTYEG